MTENTLARKVFYLGLKVHRELGPGLLESVYEECLCYELKKANIEFKRQEKVPIYYDKQKLESYLKLDIIVEDKLIIELKSVKKMEPLFFAQTLSYLKLTNCRLALLINFNTIQFKLGVQRVVNGELLEIDFS